MKQLISVTEAAARLGCSRGHVYNLIADGKLQPHDIGRGAPKTRVSAEDLDRYIAESAESPKSSGAVA